MSSIVRHNPPSHPNLTDSVIFVEWGEPLTNGLRRQRFTAFLNAIPNPLLWDISLPNHSKNTFSASLTTASVEIFLNNKQFIDTLAKNNVLPFSRVVFSPVGIDQTRRARTGIQSPPVIFPSDEEIAIEVTFDDESSIRYRCGKVSYAIDDTLSVLQMMVTIHKLHYLWLQSQPHVNWQEYSDLSRSYTRDPSFNKATRKQFLSCLQLKLLPYVISQYRTSVPLPQFVSKRKIQNFMKVVHLSHTQWLQKSAFIEDSVYQHFSHVYKSDLFLDESTLVNLFSILDEKNHQFHALHQEYLDSISDTLNCSPYSHNAEALFPPIESLQDLYRWEAMEEANSH